MLILGVFGGQFFGKNKAYSNKTKFFGTDLFYGVDLDKYQGNAYDPAKNYFNLTLGGTDRTFNMPPSIKRLHFNGWYHWYCQYYYGEKSPADTWRIVQWQKSIAVEWFYIVNGVYEGGGNRFTDLLFLPTRRQRLLEKGWDPTKAPADYGIFTKF